ncbi:MAG: tetratricopeptide repeat protein [Acidiferrobacterales bacterium]|nr:tetratricopeptide repeat protein [Acidiferrobacterales bacterium]
MLNRVSTCLKSTWLQLTILMIGCLSVPVHADQTDPRLNDLFEQLLVAPDQAAGDAITDQIWAIWREYPTDQEVADLMSEGIQAMATGRLRQAEKIFDGVIEKAPDFAEGWNKRATIRYFLRQYEKSAEDVRQTILLEPRHFGAMAGLGLIFLSLNYPKSAIEAFEKALEVNPHLSGPKMQVRRLRVQLADDPV